MDILQVITDNDRRGAQVFATDLGTAMDKRGHTVRTVALGPGHGGASLGLEVVGSGRVDVRGQLRLRSLATRADVIVAHGSSTAQGTTLSLARTRTPIVYRQISDSLRWAASPWRRARVRLYLSQMAHIVALHRGAETVLHEHFRVPSSKITVVPNGVPIDVFARPSASGRHGSGDHAAARPDRPLVALYLGALAEEKGVRLLVDLAHACPDLDVVAYGTGPMLDELRASAPANLRLEGSTDDPAGALQSADVFVFPSIWGDSMPAVLIEAGLAGLPVVATDVGAAREVVVDGTSGIIVAPGDVDAFVGAVQQLVARPAAERLAMGRAGAAQARERFDIDIVAAQWEAVLERVTDRG